MEMGYDFIEGHLHRMLKETNAKRNAGAAMPHLAALVCFSLFDIAIYDAFAKAKGVGVYDLFSSEYMTRDLSQFFGDSRFEGQFPADYLVKPKSKQLPVWHLVGGLDPISEEELTGKEPDDGYPVLLRDWICVNNIKVSDIPIASLDGQLSRWEFANPGHSTSWRHFHRQNARLEAVTKEEHVKRGHIKVDWSGFL